MEHEFFGVKKKFGVEIEVINREKNTGKAKFWIEGKSFGEFNVKHKLSYLASGLTKLMRGEEKLWDESFAGKTPAEIFEYCMSIAKNSANYPPEKYYLLELVTKFAFFFGDQFDTVNHIIYVKDGNYHFTWAVNNDYSGREVDLMKNFEYANVPIPILKEVSERFLEWYINCFPRK